MITRIISGGQTGADQGGLEAAELLGIPTGGRMPREFKTEMGTNPELAQRFGLKALASHEYSPRTRYNVVDSDATVIFGNTSEPGSRVTRRMCIESDKPYLVIDEFNLKWSEIFSEFITRFQIRTLNVAGNRESKYPGLQRKVRNFLISALREEHESRAVGEKEDS